MEQIVTVTVNPSLDVSATVERLEPHKKLRIHNVRRDAGGGGINVARAIHMLGGEAHAVYTAGGAIGRHLEALLRSTGVTHKAIPIDEQTRENFTVYEQLCGIEYRFVMPGPTLREAEWRALIDTVAALDAAYVVLSGSLPAGVPENFYKLLIQRVKHAHTKVVLDTSGAALNAGLAEGVFLVKPNLRELQSATGASLDTDEAREAAARSLIDEGRTEVVALTLAEHGALFVWREGALRLPAPKVEACSSVGAGDSFVAGLVLRLAQGASRETAFRFALAAGTAALLTPGTALCRREDAERLYEALGHEVVRDP
ncbi:MAG: 1-phosphofructokinase family hexose kinase [Gammaproteobacteria bacterium]